MTGGMQGPGRIVGTPAQAWLAAAASVGHSTYRGSRRDGNNPAPCRGHNNPEENHRAAFAIDHRNTETP
jgi:hypothetical protein